MWDARVTGRFFCFGGQLKEECFGCLLCLNSKYAGICLT